MRRAVLEILAGPSLLLVLVLAFGGTASPLCAQVEEEDLVEPPATSPGTSSEPTSLGSTSSSTPTSASGDDLVALEREADAAFARDDLEAAIALYRQVAARQPTRTETIRLWMTIAFLEHELGRTLDARRTLAEVLDLDPDYQLQADLYGPSFAPLFYDAQKEAIDRRRGQAAERVRDGLGHLRARSWAEARAAFDAALALQPDQPRALYNRALVDFHEGDLDTALAGFQKLLALHAARPDWVDDGLRSLALTNVGLIYLSKRQPDEALNSLETAVQADPENQPAWSNLGIARRRLGRPADAADAFRRAHELAPDDASTLHLLGLATLDAEDWGGAANLLAQAVERFPDRPELWLLLGRARDALGQDAGAVEAFDRAVAADPENRRGQAAAASLHLASHHLAAARPSQALAAAQRALRWRADATNAWIYQGLAQQALGQLDAALASLEQARSLDPGQAQTHVNLGSVLFELGRYEQAEAALERALAIDPQAPGARENLESVRNTRARGGSPTRARGGATAGRSPTSARPAPTDARPAPRRVDLGLRFSDVDYSSLGLQGVMVDEVFSGTAAGRAGIRSGDLLLRADGRPLDSGAALRELAAARAQGETLAIDLLRDNRPLSVTLTLP